MTPEAEPFVLGDAAQLEFLHALEETEQLVRLCVVIESGTVERDEQFVHGFECREASRFRLPLDDVPTGCRV